MTTMKRNLLAASLGFLCVTGAGAVTVGLQGCNPKTVADVAAGANLAVCVLDVYVADYGQPLPQIVADAVKHCGADAIAVERVLEAHRRATLAEKQDAGR